MDVVVGQTYWPMDQLPVIIIMFRIPCYCFVGWPVVISRSRPFSLLVSWWPLLFASRWQVVPQSVDWCHCSPFFLGRRWYFVSYKLFECCEAKGMADIRCVHVTTKRDPTIMQCEHRESHVTFYPHTTIRRIDRHSSWHSCASHFRLFHVWRQTWNKDSVGSFSWPGLLLSYFASCLSFFFPANNNSFCKL